MNNNISVCKICGSVNTGKYSSLSGYEVCFYCYTIKNKNNKFTNDIPNKDFDDLISDIKFNFKDRSNAILVNFKSAFLNEFANINYQEIKDENCNPSTNSFLKNGKIDTLIIPNIENINFTTYLKDTLKYLSDDMEIFIGFYTSIDKFKSENILNNINYIYNIYAIYKILQQLNPKLYISNFWKKDSYYLFQINKNLNRQIENSLQLALDKIFYENFRSQVSL